MKRTSLFFPTPTLDKLQRLAERLDCTQADIIRRGVDEYLIKEIEKLHNEKGIPPYSFTQGATPVAEQGMPVGQGMPK